jgi:hypothetical protein
MDTEPWPPHRGTQEHYIVKDEVWAAAGMPLGKMNPDDRLAMSGGGILCVGCIEKRLGRLLTINDVPDHVREYGEITGCQNTPRLLSRMGINFMEIANAPLPEYIVERWMRAILTNTLKEERPEVKQVDVEGDDVFLLVSENPPECLHYQLGPRAKEFRAKLRMDRPEAFEFDLVPPSE